MDDQGVLFELAGVTEAVGSELSVESVPDFELVGNKLLVKDHLNNLRPVEVPSRLSPKQFKQLVIAAYAQYVIEGKVDLDGLVRRASLPAETCCVALGALQFREALAHRGVTLTNTRILSERQDLLLLILGDPNDGLTMSQKLRKAKVGNAQFQAWLKSPVFKEQYEAIAENLHNHNADAIVQLSRLAAEGDLNAIKFKFEMNNRFNPARQQNLDILQIMSQVLEAISRHVTDAGTLDAVARDIKQIASKAGLLDRG